MLLRANLKANSRQATCAQCGKQFELVLWQNAEGTTLDSDGGMDFDDPGPVCDNCLAPIEGRTI